MEDQEKRAYAEALLYAADREKGVSSSEFDRFENFCREQQISGEELREISEEIAEGRKSLSEILSCIRNPESQRRLLHDLACMCDADEGISEAELQFLNEVSQKLDIDDRTSKEIIRIAQALTMLERQRDRLISEGESTTPPKS